MLENNKNSDKKFTCLFDEVFTDFRLGAGRWSIGTIKTTSNQDILLI